MLLSNQRLRNLTTGRLHTTMTDIYKDIEFFVGEEGIMTHQIPAAFKALLPFLKLRITDQKFWNEEYDPNHGGFTEVESLTEVERKIFWENYAN